MSYIKNKGGHPIKWKTPEELEKLIEDYFEWTENNNKHITVTGLAWWLDTDRMTLIRYENYKEWDWLKNYPEEDRQKYSYIIKRAKRYIEMNYEEGLYDRQKVTGSIFTLKNNYGWQDRTEVVTTTKENNMSESDIDKQLQELGYNTDTDM